ncbi:MAG: hypothetical protein HC915_21290 [Anaerolineae bacterium]|nr:hypothetical protein [Anaerolineae bacterium]
MLFGGVARAVYPDTLLLPLDDAYIHLQYARQMASGTPYAYNPGDAATSGATSFVYTPLLALGYGLGFRALDLSIWAVGLGLLCVLASAWLVYRSVRWSGGGLALSLLMGLAFAANGVFIWSAFSGMETALVMCMTLAVLEAYQARAGRRAALLAGLAALVRPELALVALSTALALAWNWRHSPQRWRCLSWPTLAVLVQPLVNWAVTGSTSASGNPGQISPL